MSAEGQRFGRSAASRGDAQAQWVGPSLGQQLGLGTPAPRLTHAEQAWDLVEAGCNPLGSFVPPHIDAAAEIERVAREVVEAYFEPSPAGALSVAITRLRALVQP
jgi:hypothetical protein